MQRSRSNSDPEIPAQDSRWKRLSWSITEEKQPLLGQPSNSFSPVGREQETQLNIDVDETVNETDKTLHRLLNRGEKLQDINNKANELRNTSSLFRKRSKEVETKMWWDHQYFKIAIYLLAFLLGSLLIVGLVKLIISFFAGPPVPFTPMPPGTTPGPIGGGAGLVCNCICPPVLCPYYPPPPSSGAPKGL